MIFKAILTQLVIFSGYLHADEENLSINQQAGTRELIQLLLAQDLGTRKFAFPDVVLAATGKKVLPLTLSKSSHQMIYQAIISATKETASELSQEGSPVRKLRRINEASRYFEKLIIQKLDLHPELQCSIPLNNKGNAQRSGYPDLLITHTNHDGIKTHAYLDPKLFEDKSISSSLRTFYYEPRKHTNKIQHEALHLLIGISHDGNDGSWKFTNSKVCDLFHFHVRLKAEFQASNRDLYKKPALITTPEQ